MEKDNKTNKLLTFIHSLFNRKSDSNNTSKISNEVNKKDESVVETKLGDVTVDNKALSLHDQMEKANALAVGNFIVLKQTIADYLNDNYSNRVTVKRKPNFTKTNLPLPDTHYLNSTNKCFLYVYELFENRNVFLIAKTNEEIVQIIKGKHSMIFPSAFPRTNDGGKWFAIFFDESFKTLDDVYDIIDILICGKSLKSAPVVEEQELTLKESISKANANTCGVLDTFTKESVLKWLNGNYHNEVITNHKPNYTVTDLPLPDTHYIKGEKKNTCIIYVYDLKDVNSFLIVKIKDEVIKSIKKKHPGVAPSKFPHTNDGGKWYSVLPDETFNSENSIYDLLREVIDSYTGKVSKPINPIIKEEAQPESTIEDKKLTLHEQIEKSALIIKSELIINKEAVANYLLNNYADKMIINRKANYTVTNLPLPDTHYIKGEKKNTCVIYVYELDDSKNVFLVVKSNEKTVKLIKEKHNLVSPSAFPHTNDGGKWFTVMFDDSYKSLDDLYEVVDFVLKDYLGESNIRKVKPAPKQDEPVKEKPIEINQEIEPVTKASAKYPDDEDDILDLKNAVAIDVVDIILENSSEVLHFSPNGLDLFEGDKVQVETSEGVMRGTVVEEQYKLLVNKDKASINKVVKKL